MFKVVWLPTFTSCLVKPTDVNIKEALAGTVMVNSPLSLVMVVCFELLMATVTPCSGVPVSLLITVPFMVLPPAWGKTVIQELSRMNSMAMPRLNE